MSYFITDLLVLGCINSIMVVGLNLQYGYGGLLNFAYYIYVAIGAYIAAVTTMGPSNIPGITYVLGWTLPWWVGLLLGGLVATAFGAFVFLLTVRRLRSDYLAIVTVAVAFIMYNLIDTLQPLFDGDTGLFNVPQITGNTKISTEGYSLIILALSAGCLAVFVWMSRRIFRSPFGRLLRSVREDDEVTAAFGRRSWRPQIASFMLGSFLAGIAGGLLIFYISAWSPAAFLPLESFILLAALIVGGSGNYWGSLLGAFVLIEGLAEISRDVPSFGNGANVGALRQIVIGLVLILVLRYRPEGLIPERWLRWYGTRTRSWRRWRARQQVETSLQEAADTDADRAAAASAQELQAPVPLEAAAATASGTDGDGILDIRDVAFSYGGVRAVSACSFTLSRGTVTGLIGPNGAGKSTLVEMLSGRLKPQGGEILLDAQSVGGRDPVAMSRLGVARTFQTARVLPHLPVLENVMIAASGQRGESPVQAIFWARGWRQQETALRREAVELLSWLGLSSHLERPAGSLSGGQRRLMEIARALMAHPRVLLMDEPTAGVFPETSQLIARRVREIAASGVTVLLIAHNMAFLSSVADDVVVMAEGRVLTRGPLEQVREHQDVIAAYLGVAAGQQGGSQVPSMGGGH
ncbi:MAG TPA: branched-chain amino acid ABC transporter ATP-binding protein/permease [Solirubrobacteraceae bacterium]|jgi:branched-chain amino acid transport system permease protein|nr:branched-chain amino acid ABC transporter ATP-binding protein/permease [Solirubrobacteraceae bacterium]